MGPLYIALKIQVDGIQFASSKALLAHFGHNVGNLAFVYAMTNQIMGDVAYHSDVKNRKDFKDYVRDNFDVLVFPAANNIGENSDMGWLADILEKTQLPILIVGLGVQAQFGKERFPLKSGTLRLIDILRERRTRVGVRGKFTQEFLAELGMDQVVVTGCPSNFINPDPYLGKSLESKYQALSGGLSSVALNLEYFRLDSTKVKMLTSWLSHHAGALILQSDEDVFGLMRNDFGGSKEKAEYISKYFLGNPNVSDFKKWLARFGRVYCHLPSWMDYLRCVSLSVGSRFHGNMLAIQAGVPALVFPHDTRTLEMCETMSIPYLPWDNIMPGDTIEKIVQGIHFSGKAFDERRQELARIYRGLIVDAGLDASQGLQDLCD